MALTKAGARKLLAAMRFDDRECWMAIPRMAREKAAVDAARELLAQKRAAAPALWGALELYAAAAADPAPLRPLLKHRASAVRIKAADALLERGEKDGFAVLIAALSDAEPVEGGRYAGPAWRAATEALVRRTALWRNGPPLDADAAQVAAAAQRWAGWQKTALGKLEFDKHHGEWRAA